MKKYDAELCGFSGRMAVGWHISIIHIETKGERLRKLFGVNHETGKRRGKGKSKRKKKIL